jgi:pyruvate kinase
MRQNPVRLTTIVATLGPAVADEALVRQLIEAGMDVARMNFAHGNLEEHNQTLARLRKVAEECGKFVAVLQDLAGPKLRLRTRKEKGVDVRRGDRLSLGRDLAAAGGSPDIASTYPGIVDDCREGEPVLFGDGAVRMRVAEVAKDRLILESEDDGTLASGMGINLPQTNVRLSSMGEKDWQDLEWGLAHEVDYVGLSFVRTADEVCAVKRFIGDRGGRAGVIAKIEKPQAVENIDAILAECDGLMVARGDLGVEMDLARVPIIQKDLIRRAAKAGVPVITATQMLQSMIKEPRPTRAEVSDVANAVFDGSDAVMLSGETSIGLHPVRAVEMMNHIIDEVEHYALEARWLPPAVLEDRYVWAERAIALGAAGIARDLGVALVVVLTHSGATALLLSKQRLDVPILAVSDGVDTCRRMALYRGVLPVHHPNLISSDTLAAEVERMALARKLVAGGERILIISGHFPGQPGGTDTLRVHTVSASKERGAS